MIFSLTTHISNKTHQYDEKNNSQKYKSEKVPLSNDDDDVISNSNETHGSISMLPSLNHPLEKKILKKMDMYIIPLMGLLYFLSNLDKSNIGNAQIAGLTEDLNLVGTQYNVCVTLFYVTYIVFDPVGSTILKFLGPKLMLSTSLFAFGIISFSTAWVKNYHGLLVIRLLLGASEGLIYPAINMYLSVCYRREQYAKRFAYVFTAACISSSFGGLISYGCAHVNGSLSAWQYIFIVEGCISLGCVPLFIFGLSKHLQDSWFFDEEEKEYVIERYKSMSTFNPADQFSWYQVFLAVKDIKTWVCSIALFGIDLTTFGLTVFLPSIITTMGFTNVRAQLMTVPVYFLSAVTFFICALYSDKWRLRFPFIMGACLITSVGLAIVLGSETHAVRYFGVFVLCMGIYVSAACNCLWLSGNNANYYKRATALGINLFFGSGSGILSGQVFLTKDKPKYTLGLSLCLGFQLLSFILTFVQFLLYWRENKKKEKIVSRYREIDEPVPYDELLGDLNPEFRYMY